MDVIKVFQQMIIMFSLMGIGFFLSRKKVFSKNATADFSKMIAEVCNPVLLICKVLDKDSATTTSDLLFAGLVAVIYYVVLIGVSMILPRLIKARRSDIKFYKMLSIYGNIGFMGIPLISAVMGGTAVIYLSIFIVVFNLLVYTYGVKVIASDSENVTKQFEWKRMINSGTVAALLAIVFVLIDIKIPLLVNDTLQYIGAGTTFLSMVVIGMALAQIPFKELFSESKLYIFAGIRYLILPIVVAFCLKPVLSNQTLLGVIVLTLALPAANLPLMLAEQYEVDTKLLAKGIILTTLLSVVTVTVASWVLAL